MGIPDFLTYLFWVDIWPTPLLSHIVHPMVQKNALKVSPFARYSNLDFLRVS